MRKMVFGISLIVQLVATGCTSTQLHQSLLMHENRQLEDALFVAQAQVADLERENDLLRKQQTNKSVVPRGTPDFWDEDFDGTPPLEMPKVILPGGPGETEVPESLRGSQMFPVWMPVR